MLECTASVRIAIEPVIAAAASLSTISSALEAIETAAARSFRGICASGPTARVVATAAPASIRRSRRPGHLRRLPAGPPSHGLGVVGLEVRQLAGERPGGPPAVADGVLLLRGQLGHRAAVVVVGRHEGRVVPEAAVAPRLGAQHARRSARARAPRARPAPRRRGRTRSSRAGPRRAPRAAASRGSPRRSRPRPRSARTTRRARRRARRPRSRSRPRSPGSPVDVAATRALTSALSAKVVPVSGGSSTSGGQRLEPHAAEQLRQLAQLVLVTGGQNRPHGSSLRLAAPPRRQPAERLASARCRPRRARAARRGTLATAGCARRWPGPPRARRRRS